MATKIDNIVCEGGSSLIIIIIVDDDFLQQSSVQSTTVQTRIYDGWLPESLSLTSKYELFLFYMTE